MSTVTTNMGLTVPVVGTNGTPGPTYAQEINTDMDLIDNHDHTTSKGVQVPSAGLNINTDLTFQSNNATALRSVRFSPQGTVISLGTDLNCISVAGVDLYYNDGSGNKVRITQSGGVAGSPGSISNLTSPASAQYVSATQTFIWQSDVATPANMDAGSVILRNITSGSNGLTLAPPNLTGNYTLTLPYVPGVNAFLGVDTSGNITTIASQSQGIGRTNLQAVGQKIGSADLFLSYPGQPGQQSFFISSASVTVTTTGRPVMLMVQPGTTSSSAFLFEAISKANGINNSTGVYNPQFTFSYTRDGNIIASFSQRFGGATPLVISSGGSGLTISSFPNIYSFVPPMYLDVIGAGTYVYKMQIADTTIASSTFIVQNMALVAYEL